MSTHSKGKKAMNHLSNVEQKQKKIVAGNGW